MEKLVYVLFERREVPGADLRSALIEKAAPALRASSMGVVLAFGYMGHGLGGWQGGFFYDFTGDYTWTYANAVISGLINLLIVGTLWWTVTRGRRPALA